MSSKEKRKKKEKHTHIEGPPSRPTAPFSNLFEKKREKKKTKGKNEPQYESLGEGPTLSRSLKAEKLSKRGQTRA